MLDGKALVVTDVDVISPPGVSPWALNYGTDLPGQMHLIPLLWVTATTAGRYGSGSWHSDHGAYVPPGSYLSPSMGSAIVRGYWVDPLEPPQAMAAAGVLLPAPVRTEGMSSSFLDRVTMTVSTAEIPGPKTIDEDHESKQPTSEDGGDDENESARLARLLDEWAAEDAVKDQLRHEEGLISLNTLWQAMAPGILDSLAGRGLTADAIRKDVTELLGEDDSDAHAKGWRSSLRVTARKSSRCSQSTASTRTLPTPYNGPSSPRPPGRASAGTDPVHQCPLPYHFLREPLHRTPQPR